MNDELRLLEKTIDEVLVAAMPPESDPPGHGAMDSRVWRQAVDLGWDQVGLPEDLGGLGESIAPLVVLARACGRHRAPIPAIDSALGRTVLARAGLPQPPDGTVLAVAIPGTGEVRCDGDRRAPRVHAVLRRIPWARHARHLVIGASDGVLVVDLEQSAVCVGPGANLAGEARDDIELRGAHAAAAADANVVERLGELRTLLVGAQIDGALHQVLELTREYTATREQFGRPLARFQLVAAHLAEMAAQSALVSGLVEDAVRAHDAGDSTATTASLKINAGNAATVAARAAHQCHGAIGTTREYWLHQYTRRLWSWREECGGERRWSEVLGQKALAATAADRWALTTPVEVEV